MAKRWTKAEIDYLQQHYPAKTEQDIAAGLKRTVYSVRNKLGRMGLIQENNNRALTQDEYEYMLRHYNGTNIEELAEALRIPKKRIYGELVRQWHIICGDSDVVAELHRKGLSLDKIGKRLGYSEYVAGMIYRRKKSIHPKREYNTAAKAKVSYRQEITDTTCMQLCIGDFEGLSHKVLCELYSFNPRCLPRMLEDLRRTGAYHQYIEEFKVCNPACYDRAAKRQKRKRRVG